MTEPIAPYVTSWTGEARLPVAVVVTTSGMEYADPAHDALGRDVDGVLWELRGGTATGRPDYADLHPERQRDAMENFSCAGCNGPADRDGRGMSWLLPLLGTVTTCWEGVQTTIPPTCTGCAEASPRRCPELRKGHVRLRVREAEPIGVRGTLYPRPGEPGAPEPDTLVLYDSPDLPFVVARHAVRELRRTTVVAFSAAIPLPVSCRSVPELRTVTG
ncbi:hypothetical protein [Streptomyces murinus]|uniref:hypothetical protein n=1 Tax=Streptomyces murinus TaxID=33900 RepID=UPI003823EE14